MASSGSSTPARARACRVVQEALLGAIVRTERRIQRHALARAGVELPDDAISQALEVATGAGLPAHCREPVAQGISAGDGIEIPARGEKHLRADQVGFSGG